MATITADKPVLPKNKKPSFQLDLTSSSLVGLTLIATGAIVVLVGVVLWLSFTEGTPGDPVLQYTLEHYRSLFLDGFTYRVFGNTVLFSLMTLATSFLFALPIAWLMERTDFPGKPIVFTLMTIGAADPRLRRGARLGVPAASAHRHGQQGADRAPGSQRRAVQHREHLLGMGLVEGLNLAPLAFIMTAVVLRAMDPALEEAAAISGAGPGRPCSASPCACCWPGILAAAIYVVMIGFAAFDVPAIIGLTQPHLHFLDLCLLRC